MNRAMTNWVCDEGRDALGVSGEGLYRRVDTRLLGGPIKSGQDNRWAADAVNEALSAELFPPPSAARTPPPQAGEESCRLRILSPRLGVRGKADTAGLARAAWTRQGCGVPLTRIERLRCLGGVPLPQGERGAPCTDGWSLLCAGSWGARHEDKPGRGIMDRPNESGDETTS